MTSSTRRPPTAPSPRRDRRPIAFIVRVVPVSPSQVAGEIEVVDTGDVTAFNDATELAAILTRLSYDEGREP